MNQTPSAAQLLDVCVELADRITDLTVSGVDIDARRELAETIDDLVDLMLECSRQAGAPLL